MTKILIIANNPVPYHTGIYREISKQKTSTDKVLVVYDDSRGLTPVFVPDLNTSICWKYPLMAGYKSLCLGTTVGTLKIGFLKRIRLQHVSIISRFKPDFVLLQNYMTINNLLISLICKLRGIKILLRGEAVENETRRPAFFKSCLKRLYLFYWMLVVHRVFYSCTGNKAYWRKYKFSDNILYPLSCAVDNQFFIDQFNKLKSSKQKIRRALGVDDEDRVLLMVGRVNDNKNVKLLIEVIKDKKNVHLLIVGNGPALATVKNLAEKLKVKATFAGFVDIDEIGRYYIAGDIFVSLSKYDFSPKVLNEAMNFKLPVFVSKTAGTVKDLVHDDNGIVVDVTSTSMVQSQLEQMLMSQNLEKMGEKSAEIVSQFTFERNAQEFYNAIR